MSQKKRRVLSMLPHEDEVLRTLYRDYDIPTDQYPQRPNDLMRIANSWNKLNGRKESSQDLLHYMITQRKNGTWEKLGRNSGGNFSRQRIEFSEDELATLDAIHEQLQIASDQFALNAEFAEVLQKEFAQQTGRIVPAMILAAEMISRRKDGALATLRPKVKQQDLGFADIEEISS